MKKLIKTKIHKIKAHNLANLFEIKQPINLDTGTINQQNINWKDKDFDIGKMSR